MLLDTCFPQVDLGSEEVWMDPTKLLSKKKNHAYLNMQKYILNVQFEFSWNYLKFIACGRRINSRETFGTVFIELWAV